MPTIITTQTQLQNMKNDLTANYELGSNITCTGTFDPIGGWNGQDNFTGTFDGKNYTITDLSISKNGDAEVGLFGTTVGATISNLTLSNPTVHGEDYTGALVGLVMGDDMLTNCHIVGGSVTGNQYVGGLIGYAVHASGLITISNSDTTCSVTSDIGAAGAYNDVGGFIGYANGVDFDNCSAEGDVTGVGEQVGGFVGLNTLDCLFDKCFATGDVATGNDSGDSFCGGFVGTGNGAYNDCYARGAVTATGQYVGGFAGVSPDMDDCYSTGAVTGVGAGVGGLNGNEGGTTTNCFWDTETSGQASSFGGTGKTTAQMKTQATFTDAGWNFTTIWFIASDVNNGYPAFRGLVYSYVMTAGNFAVVETRLHYMDKFAIERYIPGIIIGDAVNAAGNVAVVEERLQYVGASNTKERYWLGTLIGNATNPIGSIAVVETRIQYVDTSSKERYILGIPV